uniref:Uncharacterized protein n=1 Tax=Arundo donax TaxID=35708 RepID=A0A0A9G026_ARUDO
MRTLRAAAAAGERPQETR